MRVIAAILFVAVLASCQAPDHALARDAPHPARDPRAIPGADLVWIPDRVERREDGYVWIPGRWVRVPRATPPVWRPHWQDAEMGEVFVLFERDF